MDFKCDVCDAPMESTKAIILWDEDTHGKQSFEEWTVRDLIIVHRIRCDDHTRHCSTYLTDRKDAKHYRDKFSRQPFKHELQRGHVLQFIRESAKDLPEIAETVVLY